MRTRRVATSPVAVAAALGVVAYATGVTKKWVLSPIGSAFGDLSANGKVIVTALVVVGIVGLLLFGRLRYRSAVRSAGQDINQATPRRVAAGSP